MVWLIYPEGFNSLLKKEVERITKEHIGKKKMIYEQINTTFYWYKRNKESFYLNNKDYESQKEYLLKTLRKRVNSVKSLRLKIKTRIKLFVNYMEEHSVSFTNTESFLREE
jgi:hypothetical protein